MKPVLPLLTSWMLLVGGCGRPEQREPAKRPAPAATAAEPEADLPKVGELPVSDELQLRDVPDPQALLSPLEQFDAPASDEFPIPAPSDVLELGVPLEPPDAPQLPPLVDELEIPETQGAIESGGEAETE